MLTMIVTFLASIGSKIASNPKILIGVCIGIFVLAIFIAGCELGKSRQKATDESTISDLKARIAQIENAPVREYTERTTTEVKPEPTKTLIVTGKPTDVSLAWRKRLDSLEAALGDTVSKLIAEIEFLATPYDSITAPDTLKVDSLFVMPYRLYLAAQNPLDRLLAGLLIVEPFDVHRDKLIREITIPPLPKQWYEYLWDVLKFLAGVFTGKYIL